MEGFQHNPTYLSNLELYEGHARLYEIDIAVHGLLSRYEDALEERGLPLPRENITKRLETAYRLVSSEINRKNRLPNHIRELGQ